MAFKFWTDLWDGSLLGTLTKIRSELTAIQPQDSEDIIWERTQSGVKARFADALPSGGESDSESEPTQVVSSSPAPIYEPDTVMAKIVGNTEPLGYVVDLYADGKDADPTALNMLMFLPEVSLNTKLPVGAWVLAHRSSVFITGGNA